MYFGRPCECGGGYAVDACKHLVHCAQHLFLHGHKFFVLFALFACLAQLNTKLAQLSLEYAVEGACIVAAECLAHCLLGYNAIFCNKVGYAGECTAVAQGVVEEPLYHSVVDGLFACVDDSLQEKVRFFKLVEEEIVHLRELESVEILLGNHLGSHYVEACEQPATAR